MTVTTIPKTTDKPHQSWPNIQTGITITCIVTNIACSILHTSVETSLIANAPIRAASIITAIFNKNYIKAAVEVPSFFVLFLQFGVFF